MSSIELNALPQLTVDDLPRRLAAALDETRPARAAQSRMAPELSYGRHGGPAPATARRAAVILLVFRRGDRWYLPLTERPATLARHGGQISLPGGVLDAGESSSQAALRELDEELGIKSSVEMLGHLADCYVFASDFLITPWVAAVSGEPAWHPHDREVQGVLELPLDALFDQKSVGRMTIERGPLAFHAACFRAGSACIWGATSVILDDFAVLLDTVSA